MAQPFYYYGPTTYNGHDIEISVEINADQLTLINGSVVDMHKINASVDGLPKVTDELNPKDAISAQDGPAYLSLDQRLAQILTNLQHEIDEIDELDALLTSIGFTGGSEPVINFQLIPGAASSGDIGVDWDTDADFAVVEISRAELVDKSDASVIASGALADPYTITGISGSIYYFRMRGQRTGSDWGPYTEWLMETAP